MVAIQDDSGRGQRSIDWRKRALEFAGPEDCNEIRRCYNSDFGLPESDQKQRFSLLFTAEAFKYATRHLACEMSL
jgi:hypothetical protein